MDTPDILLTAPRGTALPLPLRGKPSALFLFPNPGPQRLAGGTGFGFLLALALAGGEHEAAPRDFGLKDLAMIGTALAKHPVRRSLRMDRLQALLQFALGVPFLGAAGEGLDLRL